MSKFTDWYDDLSFEAQVGVIILTISVLFSAISYWIVASIVASVDKRKALCMQSYSIPTEVESCTKGYGKVNEVQHAHPFAN